MPEKTESINQKESFKVMCSKCEFQLKNSELTYEPAIFYLWLTCPKCKCVKFYLLKEKR